MKRLLLLTLSLLLLHACKPEKPWSPAEDKNGGENPLLNAAVNTALPISIDIGDAEQGVYLEATIAPESLADNVKQDKIKSGRDRLAIVNVKVTPPVPDKLWATYAIKCTRDFAERPVVLRARIMVEGKPVGSIEALLGKVARRSAFATNVDLLSKFDKVPASFLATIDGELILLPEGTDESTVNPETATSDITSKAVECNPIRVDIEGATPAEPTAATEATGPAAEASENSTAEPATPQ